MLIPASPEAAASLAEIDPLLAWGVLTRGLGVVYAIAFASIPVPIRGPAGRDGMSPFAPMMQQMAHDFPGWRRLLYFPTLLWLTGGGDAALVGLPVAGVGFGLAAAYGGAASPLALAACWATLRSLDLPVGLLYPWDSLLLEAGALDAEPAELGRRAGAEAGLGRPAAGGVGVRENCVERRTSGDSAGGPTRRTSTSQASARSRKIRETHDGRLAVGASVADSGAASSN